MKVTLSTAYSILRLPYGSPVKEVSKSCRELAREHISDKKKIREIFSAYKRIAEVGQTDQVVMDMESMKMLMKKFLNYGDNDRSIHTNNTDDQDCSSDDSDHSPGVAQAKSDKIANDLISEEEKEKRKAEKRRAKKKKQREKKKLEKEQEQITADGNTDGKQDGLNGVSRSSDEGEGIDPNAAFVKKSKNRLQENEQTRQESRPDTITDKTSSPADVSHSLSSSPASKPVDQTHPFDSSVISIAIKGNQMAQNGDYPAAIKSFSEAIKLDPSDFRFFGNRSYCFDRIMQFDRALADAEKCIELSPGWPKGHFRKGRALAGLKMFQDAEKAFCLVLKLDKDCEEAQKELSRVRTQQLIDMGFSPKQAESAILHEGSLQKAVDSLLAGVGADLVMSSDDIYISDDETGENWVPTSSQAAPAAPKHNASTTKIKNRIASVQSEQLVEEKKMDPSNPEGLTALWVGNVLPSVKEMDLQKLFSRYGHVTSVRCLPEKYCAFVNFGSKEAAGKAMNALQDHEVQGQNLLIKFPDNPIASGNTVVTKVKVNHTHRQEKKPAVVAPPMSGALKASGPVNGDECYFWRTTGCQFGDKCRHRHIKENKGCDRKPWQKVR